MKRMIAVVVLLFLAVGCESAKPKALGTGDGGSAKSKAIAPWPSPTEEQKYLEGFMEGYRGVRPLDRHARRGGRDSHSQGVRDGYAVGRRDEMQQR